MQNKKILITGAKGQLGLEIKKMAFKSKNTFFFTDSDTLDITQKKSVKNFVQENNIDIIVNCAAYTNVDKAEEEEELVTLINSDAVYNLVMVCKENKIALVHISTDYVFGGTKNTPYKETDITSPLGVYGKTKLEGEQAIISANIDYLIVRTSWLYSLNGSNFVKTIKKLSKEKLQIRVVFDQVGTPTYAEDLAKWILYAINNNLLKNKKEIYHFSNEGVCSWYDFAVAIVEELQHNCKVIPCYSDEYITKVVRPNYSVLDKTKLRKEFKYDIPHWREALKRCLKENK